MSTFADLGIPMPLFAGPVDDAAGWSAVAAAVADLDVDVWDDGLADGPSNTSSVTVYVFGCPVCAAMRGHWDSD